MVFPETQGWHCFGACGEGGDVFTFIMKRENLPFGEALRLLIPMRLPTTGRDQRGHVAAFDGRVLRDEDVPKCLNSPQTALFDKSAILFSLDMARETIRRWDQAVIVEGYMDVLQAR